jgi:hypothetical protein
MPVWAELMRPNRDRSDGVRPLGDELGLDVFADDVGSDAQPLAVAVLVFVGVATHVRPPGAHREDYTDQLWMRKAILESDDHHQQLRVSTAP